ncbi:MBL fold metallo-hydrolase [bacterium]|nr:MBL fold metallo-hydrolase [bacterium]
MDLDNVHWLGHSTVHIVTDISIYFDPYHLPHGAIPADLILITHEHYDHCSMDDIVKIKTEKTVLVVPRKNANQFSGQVIGVAPGDQITAAGIPIQVIPAYNINKPYHPKDRQYVGYIIEVEGVRCYHAGDTDHIPEMQDVKTDIAFLPVSGTYTMNAQEAAEAAEIIRPKLAVPIHWGSVAGYRTDAEQFIRLSRTRSLILEQETEPFSGE